MGEILPKKFTISIEWGESSSSGGGILWFRLVAMKFSNPIGCHEIQQTGWMLEVKDLVGRFRLFEIFYRNWEGLNYQKYD